MKDPLENAWKAGQRVSWVSQRSSPGKEQELLVQVVNLNIAR